MNFTSQRNKNPKVVAMKNISSELFKAAISNGIPSPSKPSQARPTQSTSGAQSTRIPTFSETGLVLVANGTQTMKIIQGRMYQKMKNMGPKKMTFGSSSHKGLMSSARFMSAPSRMLQSFHGYTHTAAKTIPVSDQLAIYDCIEFIKENGLQTVGIFRIPGSNELVTSTLETYRAGKVHHPLEEMGCELNVACSMLKKLVQQLVPIHLYKTIIKAVRIGTGNDHEEVTRQILMDAILGIPHENAQVLGALLNLLYIVSTQSDSNKMTLNNLAVVFAPTLIHAPDNYPPEKLMKDMPIAIEATKLLIENATICAYPVATPEEIAAKRSGEPMSIQQT